VPAIFGKVGVTGAGKNKSRVAGVSDESVLHLLVVVFESVNEKVFAGNDEFAVSVGNDAEILEEESPKGEMK